MVRGREEETCARSAGLGEKHDRNNNGGRTPLRDIDHAMINWAAKAQRRLRIADMIGGSVPMNAFDQFLSDAREELAGACWLQPFTDVADIMFGCKKWFEGRDVAFNASDLLVMTRLVLEREQTMREEAVINTSATHRP
jgi:hypothetical protein